MIITMYGQRTSLMLQVPISMWRIILYEDDFFNHYNPSIDWLLILPLFHFFYVESHSIKSELKINFVKPILTVRVFLEKHEAVGMLQDSLLAQVCDRILKSTVIISSN